MSVLAEALTRGGACKSVRVVLVVQWVLHSEYKERVWSTSHHVMVGWEPWTVIVSSLGFAG